MSTLEIEKTDNITYIRGELTTDFNEMMNELDSNPHFMFGDINQLIDINKKSMKPEDIEDLITNGTTDEYYQDRDAFCYLCVRQSDLKNYMFSPLDNENRDNKYNRLREGIRSFAKEGFIIYIIH